MRLWNPSWPAVSHNCSLTVLPSRHIVLERKSIPMVAWYVLSKLSYLNPVINDVLPTLCLPRKTSLNFLKGLLKSGADRATYRAYVFLPLSSFPCLQDPASYTPYYACNSNRSTLNLYNNPVSSSQYMYNSKTSMHCWRDPASFGVCEFMNTR